MLSVTKKLQVMGGSVFIVLPKIWIDSRGLKPRDTVELVLNEDLIIKAGKAGNKAK